MANVDSVGALDGVKRHHFQPFSPCRWNPIALLAKTDVQKAWPNGDLWPRAVKCEKDFLPKAHVAGLGQPRRNAWSSTNHLP